jgi:transketolase
MPSFPAGQAVSTRSASGKVLTALADVVPELWGGSADLAGSNNTTMVGQPSFLPTERSSKDFSGDPFAGRVLHFGIREHAMGGILNAINVTGLTRAYGGTFLVFSDYMRGAVRLAALSKIPTVFVFSHDSIGVGEDGPTHQPIEHVASLRLIPGLDVVRPADANETAAAWAQILANQDHPAALILSRQNLAVFDREAEAAPASEVSRGAYTLVPASSDPEIVVVATGSEVEIAVAAREKLEAEGHPTAVVSAPCLEWFAQQPEEYRQAVLPENALKISVEAGVTTGWREIIGANGRMIGVDHFGASAAAATLYQEFGLTADRVVEEARAGIAQGK